MLKLKTITAATALAVSVAGAASAQLGSAQIGGYAQAYTYGGFNLVAPLYGPGSASALAARLQIASSPGAAVLADAPSVYAYGTFATGSVRYQAEVLGGSGVVPLRLNFDLWTQSVMYGSASAGVAIGNTFYQEVARNGQAYSSQSYLIDYQAVNTPFSISVNASAQTGGLAYADPFLEIDPTWAAANPGLASQVSLEFSPDVANGLGNLTAGVPEPTTWALMLVGGAFLGGALRGRGRRTRATA